MLIYRRTSLLEASSQTIVNTVNCVGVMGKGIAKEFRKRDPAMFAAYRQICDQKLLEPGILWIWRGSPNWILNFPTKRHWRNPSKMEWIEAGLRKFVATYKSQGITEISFPKLGCGNGNLEWRDVKPLMEHYLSALPLPVYIHDYTKDIGLPEHLDHLAAEIASAVARDLSFPNFIRSLEQITKLAPQISADEGGSFRAYFNEETLHIQTREGNWSFESDDLRGVWISLMNGLVTKEKAGWTASGAAIPLLTLMRLLPDVRTVQIQKQGELEPEIAVELKPRAASFFDAHKPKVQPELPWH